MKAIPKAEVQAGSRMYSGLSPHGEDRSPVLPAGKFNPAKQLHKYPDGDTWMDGEGCHVLKTNDGKYRVANIWGNDYVYWDVGTRVYLMQDQTRRRLGPESGYTVVGTIMPDGRREGEIPDKFIPVVVFK